MDRSTLRSRFRSSNPEITERVVSDSVLNGWMQDGDKDICAFTKCIISNTPATFNTVVGTQYYDLTSEISKFFEIDEYPGGAVWYDNDPLDKASESEMNYTLTNWKTADNSTPQKYFRRGKWLWFDYAPDAVKEVGVSTVYISDDFDDDAKTPFNQLSYLEPYHPGILKYCQWKAQQKIDKDGSAAKAEKEYYIFIKRMKKNIGGAQNNAAYFINRSNFNSSNGNF